MGTVSAGGGACLQQRRERVRKAVPFSLAYAEPPDGFPELQTGTQKTQLLATRDSSTAGIGKSLAKA